MLYELDRNFDISANPHLQLNTSDYDGSDGRNYIGTDSITSTLLFTIEGNNTLA